MSSRIRNSARTSAALPVLLGLCCATVLSGAVAVHADPVAALQADKFQPGAAGAATVIVHPRLGGAIIGYDIDRSGTEGLLAEGLTLADGNLNVATETFDQTTGKILKVVAKKTDTPNDYVTQGIWGGLGLDLYERETRNGIRRIFRKIDPLNSGTFTGKWTPPIKKDYQLFTTSVSPEGTANVAAYQVIFDGSFKGDVFSSNIATNTFGPQIPLLLGDLPLLAYDSKTNHAVLAHYGSPTSHPLIQTVDLTTGKVRQFSALGVDVVGGVAVDSATGTACVTTQGSAVLPPMVEFYDLAKQTGFGVTLPDSYFGLDVEFDSINKLFLVADTDFVQFNILVYDEQGSLQETIAVQKLPVSPSLIALNPGKRIGFLPVIVEGEVQELQSFTY
jgi:hypothetical protein